MRLIRHCVLGLWVFGLGPWSVSLVRCFVVADRITAGATDNGQRTTD